jgi:hypothetical protein
VIGIDNPTLPAKIAIEDENDNIRVAAVSFPDYRNSRDSRKVRITYNKRKPVRIRQKVPGSGVTFEVHTPGSDSLKPDPSEFPLKI